MNTHRSYRPRPRNRNVPASLLRPWLTEEEIVERAWARAAKYRPYTREQRIFLVLVTLVVAGMFALAVLGALWP